jgi:hypothetical protein
MRQEQQCHLLIRNRMENKRKHITAVSASRIERSYHVHVHTIVHCDPLIPRNITGISSLNGTRNKRSVRQKLQEAESGTLATNRIAFRKHTGLAATNLRRLRTQVTGVSLCLLSVRATMLYDNKEMQVLGVLRQLFHKLNRKNIKTVLATTIKQDSVKLDTGSGHCHEGRCSSACSILYFHSNRYTTLFLIGGRISKQVPLRANIHCLRETFYW